MVVVVERGVIKKEARSLVSFGTQPKLHRWEKAVLTWFIRLQRRQSLSLNRQRRVVQEEGLGLTAVAAILQVGTFCLSLARGVFSLPSLAKSAEASIGVGVVF